MCIIQGDDDCMKNEDNQFCIKITEVTKKHQRLYTQIPIDTKLSFIHGAISENQLPVILAKLLPISIFLRLEKIVGLNTHLDL